MPYSPTSALVKKIEQKKAQTLRLEEARQEALYAARQLLLTASEEGFSNTYLAKIWHTNPTRMKHILAQAQAERSGNG